MKKKNVFLRAFLIYCAILLVAVASLLVVFYQFLSAYESARPEHAVESFFVENGKQYCLDALSEQIASGYNAFSDTGASLADFGIDETGELTWRASSGDDFCQYYDLRIGGKTVGRASVVPDASVGFGMHTWCVENCTFSAGKDQTLTLYVPIDCTATVNGVAVDDAYLTGTTQAEVTFSQDFDIAPLYSIYQIDAMRGPVEVKAYDMDGTELDPVRVTESEVAFTCPKPYALDFWTAQNALVEINGVDVTDCYSETIGDQLSDAVELRHYVFTDLYTEPYLAVLVDGEAVNAVELSLGACFIPNASATVSDEIAAFTDRFIHVYVDYVANKNDKAENNFYYLHTCLVKDTPFYKTCRASIEGISWADTDDLTYHETGCYDLIPLPDGGYVCHITYHVSYLFSGTLRDITADNVILIRYDGKEYLVESFASDY